MDCVCGLRQKPEKQIIDRTHDKEPTNLPFLPHASTPKSIAILVATTKLP